MSKLFTFGIFHLVCSDCGSLQVTETVERKTMEKVDDSVKKEQVRMLHIQPVLSNPEEDVKEEPFQMERKWFRKSKVGGS
jgi:hypothetical protein